MRQLLRWAPSSFLLLVCQGACQKYDFVYQPDANRQGSHLRFTVQSPSKADLLFVIDNSGSMASKQAALTTSIGHMLDELAPMSTKYRIAIVSTDAYGSVEDCNGQPLAPVAGNTYDQVDMGARGNCDRPEVVLKRPNDGTLGRLMAAFDPAAFNPNNFSYLPVQDGNTTPRAALISLLPTDATHGGLSVNGDVGARAVIDRSILGLDACQACGCAPADCHENTSCFDACANPVSEALVLAYFTANVAGLGVKGFGWEEGLKAGMWAVGIDPSDNNDSTALTPTYNLLADGQPNAFVDLSPAGTPTVGPWIRDDALLAMMFVSDEQDCSMPLSLLEERQGLETDGTGTQLSGSLCYMAHQQPSFFSPRRLSNLLTAAKGNTPGKVAVGVIGALKKTGVAPAPLTASAVAQDCVTENNPTPTGACSCTDDSDPRWCQYTENTSGPDSGLPRCDALSASRYVSFANGFERHTFESICRDDPQAYGEALSDFARIATLACFELNDLRPAAGDPNNITVTRTAKLGDGHPVLLPMTNTFATTQGWYYQADANRICLTGLDRLIGDAYDIFILDTNFASYLAAPVAP